MTALKPCATRRRTGTHHHAGGERQAAMGYSSPVQSVLFRTTKTPRTLQYSCRRPQLDGQGLLFTGASGAGKSTLTVALLRAGFGLLGDDTLFLTQNEEGIRALAFPDEVDVTEQTIGFFPELSAFSDARKNHRNKAQVGCRKDLSNRLGGILHSPGTAVSASRQQANQRTEAYRPGTGATGDGIQYPDDRHPFLSSPSGCPGGAHQAM